MSINSTAISSVLQVVAVGGDPKTHTDASLQGKALPSNDTAIGDRTLVNTALGKLTLLNDYGPAFSESVRSYIRITLDAKNAGRQLTQPERAELRKIEESFCHSMAGNTLKLISGHIVRLLGHDQKLEKGIADPMATKTESDKILADIDKRLGFLTTWFVRAQELQPMARMALAAYEDTKKDFKNARYTQDYHNSRGIDCSGLVGEYLTRLLKEAGIREDLTGVTTHHLFNMDKYSKDHLIKTLRKYFDIQDLKKLGIENLREGDAIVRRKGGEGHTGVYIGNGQIMHSTRDRDQNGFGIDTIHEFLRRNREHKVIRLKPEYSRNSAAIA